MTFRRCLTIAVQISLLISVSCGRGFGEEPDYLAELKRDPNAFIRSLLVKDNASKATRFFIGEFPLLTFLEKDFVPDKETTEAILTAAQDPDANVRNDAVLLAGMYCTKKKELIAGVLIALKDKDDAVRRNAISAIRTCGADSKPAVPILIEMLKDKDLDYYVSHALADLGVVAIPALIEALKNPDASIRAGAASSLAVRQIDFLGAMGKIDRPETEAAIPALIEALKDESCDVRLGAAYALEQIGLPAQKAVPALTESLSDKDLYVRFNAADALAKMERSQQSIPIYIDMLSDEKFRLRAAERLIDLKQEAACLPTLREMLKDKSSMKQIYVCELLIKANDHMPCVEPLQSLLGDVDDGIRIRAAKALGEIGPAAKEAIPSLVRALGDEHRWVRNCSIGALEAIGIKSEKVLKALKQVRDLDKDEYVAKEAGRVLSKLSP